MFLLFLYFVQTNISFLLNKFYINLNCRCRSQQITLVHWFSETVSSGSMDRFLLMSIRCYYWPASFHYQWSKKIAWGVSLGSMKTSKKPEINFFDIGRWGNIQKQRSPIFPTIILETYIKKSTFTQQYYLQPRIKTCIIKVSNHENRTSLSERRRINNKSYLFGVLSEREFK